jgi:hypothetical protein
MPMHVLAPAERLPQRDDLGPGAECDLPQLALFNMDDAVPGCDQFFALAIQVGDLAEESHLFQENSHDLDDPTSHDIDNELASHLVSRKVG